MRGRDALLDPVSSSSDERQALAHATFGTQPALPQRLRVDILSGGQFLDCYAGGSGKHDEPSGASASPLKKSSRAQLTRTEAFEVWPVWSCAHS